ncbi:MAG: hypothetical protein QHC79_25535 [Pseudosphingobacterium sp.]|nr:hypothetical protein [Pseudosphingobacterium sp.]
MEKLTILSFGAGQDSTYILYRMMRDSSYKKNWVNGNLVVIMSDTGNEHPETYRQIDFAAKLCASHQIPFFFITPDMGYHPRTWQSLTGQFKLNDSIMSKMFPRSCTDNLKLRPFYNFLNDSIHRTFYPALTADSLPGKIKRTTFPPKFFVKQFVKDTGTRIRVILGIAAGEEKRVKLSKQELKNLQLSLFSTNLPKRKQPVWMDKCIEKVYPMITEGADRSMAQQYILATPWPLPVPSNCMFCPFKNKIEVLWLHRNYPESFEEWAGMEASKIQKSKSKGLPDDRNLGVNGLKLLPEYLKEAIEEFGHMTDSELEEYRMSHGHCVMSTY